MNLIDKKPAPGKDSSHHYNRIASLLAKQIRGGAFVIGGPLPSETNLMERFGVSRFTIREAVRLLESLGYLARRQGARSVLLSRNPDHVFVNSVANIGNLLLYTRKTRREVVAVETIDFDAALVKRLQYNGKGRWIRLLVLRYEADIVEPLCYSEVYVPEQYSNALNFLGETPVHEVIEQKLGLVCVRIDQEIEAKGADKEIASHLGIDLRFPVLSVRTTFRGIEDNVVEIAVAHFPEGRYRVQINLKRDTPPRG